MARYFDVHPVNPQARSLSQVVEILRGDGVIAYPTDSGYALGIRLGNKTGLDRIKRIRKLDDRHHFTLMCSDFKQLGQFVHLDNSVFRAVKANTPGAYTFILPATKEVPNQFMHPKKKTVGVRIPTHVTAGFVVASQNDRSQHKNRATAMGMLKARLYEAEMRKREEAASGEYQAKTEIGWGHQIRSYVLQPYQMVKDLRTGVTSPTPSDVLDGALDPFMAAALAQQVTGEKVDVEDVD